ncbi:MAG: hypothetical protein AAF636_08265 [Pseudomonadota bacterium]
MNGKSLSDSLKETLQNGAAGYSVLACSGVLALAIWFPQGHTAPETASVVETSLEQRVFQKEARLGALTNTIAARPVFHASRRPVAAPEAAPTPKAVLSLVGVIGNEDESIALMKVSTSSEVYRLKKGGSIGPWSVVSIASDRVYISEANGEPFQISF